MRAPRCLGSARRRVRLLGNRASPTSDQACRIVVIGEHPDIWQQCACAFTVCAMIKRLDVAYACPDFLDAYNEDLERLGCKARVIAPAGAWHAGSLQIVDLNGNPIGVIPHSVETIELAAFLHILDRTFQRGVTAGKSMTNSL